MIGLFKQKAIKSKEETFWSWFVDNKMKIESFVNSDHSDYSVYNSLTEQIKNYSPVLFPELTKTNLDEFVLIITPDGLKEGVEPAKTLAAAAPPIKNWIIKKFRQAQMK